MISCSLPFRFGFALAVCLATLTATTAQAQLVEDPIGKQLGCETAPDQNPYCTDPQIRKLVVEQDALFDQLATLPTLEITREMRAGSPGTIPTGTALRQMQIQASIQMNRCRRKLACMQAEMEERTSVLRVLAGYPADVSTLLEGDIAATQNAQEEIIAELQRAADAIREEHAAEWEKARKASAPTDDPDGILGLFAFKHRAPDRWWRDRTFECRNDLECLAERPKSLDELVAYRKKAESDAAERVRIAKQEEREKQQEEERKAAEAAFKERERERKEAEFNASLLAAGLDKYVPPGSPFRTLMVDGFEAFDEEVAKPYAIFIGNGLADLATAFGNAQLAPIYREAAFEKRAILMAAAYGLTRKEALGFCGNDVVEQYVGTTDVITTRTLSGRTISQSGGERVYIQVPEPFAPYVRQTHFEAGSDRFLPHIERLESCDNPIRLRLEQNMLRFAQDGDFVPWPED